MSAITAEDLPDAHGHFGPYGGRYVPETLMHPLQELEEEYFRAQHDPEFQRELALLSHGILRSPHAALFCRTPHQGTRRRENLSQARRPDPHRRAQNQQRHGPDSSRQAHGQDAHHRRDRRGPARRRHRHGERDVRDEMRHLHGRGGLRTADAQCVSHENARRGSRAGARRAKDLEGSRQRSDARLGHECPQHALHSRHGLRRASVSGDGAEFSAHHRRRSARADFGKGKASARPAHRVRRRRLECHRTFLSVPRRRNP